jgi:glycosyltransferase involved in cell wall biosynthesis
VVAVVPAHDEERTVARTVRALASIEALDAVVVVADGCVDGTAGEAAGAGAEVLVTGRRLRKGAALEGAIRRVGPLGGCLLIDADVGDDAVEGARLLEAVLDGEADLAIGRLPPLEGGGFGIVRRAARALVHLASGFDASAPLSGQRALGPVALDACRPLAAGFGVEVAMTIDAVRAGLRVVEIPVSMRHRPTGRGASGFAHRAGQAVDILGAAAPRLVRLR